MAGGASNRRLDHLTLHSILLFHHLLFLLRCMPPMGVVVDVHTSCFHAVLNTEGGNNSLTWQRRVLLTQHCEILGEKTCP